MFTCTTDTGITHTGEMAITIARWEIFEMLNFWKTMTIKDFEDKNSKEQLFYPLLLIKSAISKILFWKTVKVFEIFENISYLSKISTS